MSVLVARSPQLVNRHAFRDVSACFPLSSLDAYIARSRNDPRSRGPNQALCTRRNRFSETRHGPPRAGRALGVGGEWTICCSTAKRLTMLQPGLAGVVLGRWMSLTKRDLPRSVSLRVTILGSGQRCRFVTRSLGTGSPSRSSLPATWAELSSPASPRCRPHL